MQIHFVAEMQLYMRFRMRWFRGKGAFWQKMRVCGGFVEKYSVLFEAVS